MDYQDHLVRLERMDTQAHKDHLVHLEQEDPLVMPQLVHLELLVPPDLLEPLESGDHLEL